MRLPPLALLLFAPALACPSAAPDDDDAVAQDDDDSTDDRLLFAFPVAQPWRIDEVVVGVDHDPVVQDGGAVGRARCENYAGLGFPRCYDEHQGSDFILEGGFDTMDDGSADVVAAANGVVLSIEDDQYDRCHVAGTSVTCDGNPMVANHVILEHADGTTTRYWHLKRDSVLVAVGDTVDCGDPLALVGSSGNSSMPHLHFQVELPPDDAVLDPYAGPKSRDLSWWREQDGPFGLPGQSCGG